MDNLVVLDFSRYIAGPHCTMLLGDMGAEIIKVETVGKGDDSRNSRPWVNGTNPGFTGQNRNKKSLALNTRDPRGMEILKQLLPHVDVVVQNFRPGTIEKMGLTWEYIHEVNPRAIMTNISGFGQDGPSRDRISFNSIALAEGGLTAHGMEDNNGIPYEIGGAVADFITALYGTVATLGALHQRELTGLGQYLDIDMISSIAGLFAVNIVDYGANGAIEESKLGAPNFYMQCKDGYCRVSAHIENIWERLRRAVPEPALLDSRFDTQEGRIAAEEEIAQIVNRWSVNYTRDEIVEMFTELETPVGAVRPVHELYDNPHIKARNGITYIDVPNNGKLPYFAFPFRMGDTKIDYDPAPLLGEHTDEILTKYLAMSPDKIAELRAAAIVG